MKIAELKTARPLFAKWALMNLLTIVFLIVMGLAYGSRIQGPSLIAAPLILVTFFYASAYAGRICWKAEAPLGAYKPRLLHELRYILFWAWVAPNIGIMGTILSLFLLLSGGSSTQNVHDLILNKAGVTFTGTFVGVFVTLVLTTMHRMIEHDLEA